MSCATARPTAARLSAALAVAIALVAIATGVAASSAQAAVPWWRLEATPAPTILQPGHEGQIVLSAIDVGDEEINGTTQPITITDTLPKGVKVIPWNGATPCTELKSKLLEEGITLEACMKTAYGGKEFRCITTPGTATTGDTITCTFKEKLTTFEVLQVFIPVEVEATPGKLTDAMSVSGGERSVVGGPAPESSISPAIEVAEAPTTFGISRFELAAESEGGGTETQAGAHPFQLNTLLDFNQTLETNAGTGQRTPSAPALVKDLQVKLPPGLVGDTNPDAIPQCSGGDFSTIVGNGNVNRCPDKTAVGVAVVSINEPFAIGYTHRVVPVFNLIPAPGEPARFGFEVLKLTVVLDTAVRTGEDYSVVASVKNATQVAQVLGSQVIIWGEPGNQSHDNARGWNCLINGRNAGTEEPAHTGCTPEERGEERLKKSFLALPTSCNAAWQSSVLTDSWLEPGEQEADGSAIKLDPRWKHESWESAHLTGCDKPLPFEPTISVEPETHAANTPSGLTVDVHLPQAQTEELGGVAVSAIKETTVALPEGVLLSPSAANGLEACSTGLVGFTGLSEFEPSTPTLTFTRHIPEPNELNPGVNFCPNGSKVGVVHIKTPDLPNEIEGGVYLAQQNANPFGSLFAMYIIAQDPVSKVLVKLAGEISLNTSTGRVTTTFKNTPQLPFEDLKLELFGGPRASITTPSTCGTYTTDATFVPWAAPASAKSVSSTFNITSGAEGSGCANPLPLAPGFKAGSTSPVAGGFTGFELTLSHRDQDQAPTSLSMRLPPGLAALLSSVTLCSEPQASQGTCGPDSLIGHASATAGLGSQPFTETGGTVYITGPYGGAPFGLTVVIPTVAGPFNFGNVVTRSALIVDPNTAAVTINSALPTMVNTTSTTPACRSSSSRSSDRRSGRSFQFNPTNCNPMSVTGDADRRSGRERGRRPRRSRSPTAPACRSRRS